MATTSESIPLVHAVTVEDAANDAAIARALSEQEVAAVQRAKGVRVVEARAYDDGQGAFVDSSEFRYGAWRRNGRPVVVYDNGDIPPAVLTCWILFFCLLLICFIIGPIIYYYTS
jgi:hypothetical protein